jgi:5-methylcytosine-specific restriction protein A
MFEIGQVYNRRRDIHSKYGGQEQGGISTPKNWPNIFLFTADAGQDYGYRDGWAPNGEYLYIGEGQKGDMEFQRGNRAIRDHEKQGKELHLFKQVARGSYEYMGEFRCASWEVGEGKDQGNHSRKAIIFHLVEA